APATAAAMHGTRRSRGCARNAPEARSEPGLRRDGRSPFMLTARDHGEGELLRPAWVRSDTERADSPPPCGEGLGVGETPIFPPPCPSPHGEGTLRRGSVSSSRVGAAGDRMTPGTIETKAKQVADSRSSVLICPDRSSIQHRRFEGELMRNCLAAAWAALMLAGTAGAV